MSFFLAVDASGTKTDCVLADETRELVRVRTGTIKGMQADSETAACNLNSALSQITSQRGVSMRSIVRTCVGTTGESVPLVAEWPRHAMTSRVSGGLLLLGDVEIALDAAFPGQPGVDVLVLAGTGSNVAGRMKDGTLTTAGGWGPALSNQGSVNRIGLESLRAEFLAKDEGRNTRLLQNMMDFWPLATLDLLVEYANHIPSPDYSALPELSGSIVDKVPPIQQALISCIQREFSGVQMLAEVVDPLAGAVWRAQSLSYRFRLARSTAARRSFKKCSWKRSFVSSRSIFHSKEIVQ